MGTQKREKESEDDPVKLIFRYLGRYKKGVALAILIKLLGTFPAKVAEAGAALSPAVVANYCYELAKEFNQYYHDTPILKEADDRLLRYRLELIAVIARTLRSGTLGIVGPRARGMGEVGLGHAGVLSGRVRGQEYG